MQYHVTEFYKTPVGYYEGPVVITTSWEGARACAVERFFELYNNLCNEVGDRLDTYVHMANEPSQPVPLFAIREHFNEPDVIQRCAKGEKATVSMDGGDYVSIHLC